MTDLQQQLNDFEFAFTTAELWREANSLYKDLHDDYLLFSERKPIKDMFELLSETEYGKETQAKAKALLEPIFKRILQEHDTTSRQAC